jgi:DNA mismatch endonuclease (patch repair protein)
VFVDGCFWHGCPTCARNMPTNRRDFWVRKISQNVRRDNRVRNTLRRNGYSVMRIWEHSIGTNEGWTDRLMKMLSRPGFRKTAKSRSTNRQQ